MAAGKASFQRATAAKYWPTDGWQSSSPEQQGMSSQMLAELFKTIKQRQLNLYSLLIIRNGYIVAEANKGNIDNLYPIFSSTKSITSALVGIAINRGLLQSEEQKVYPLLDHNKLLLRGDFKSQLTIKHLLSMSCAFTWPEIELGYNNPDNPLFKMMQQTHWSNFVLQQSMLEPPGQRFNYNSGCTQLLMAMIDKALHNNNQGSTADFAQSQLFTPLGITAAHYNWQRTPLGILNGSSGFSMKPRDMAKIGYLYLKGGHWQGQQLVAKSWVDQAVEAHLKLTWQGFISPFYGLGWYIQPFGFHSLGYQGQYIFVIPEQQMVVVVTANLKPQNIDAPIALVRDGILPAVISPTVLKADKTAQQQLIKLQKAF